MGRRSAASRPRLLLFAEPLQREGLSQWLRQGPEPWQVIQEEEATALLVDRSTFGGAAAGVIVAPEGVGAEAATTEEPVVEELEVMVVDPDCNLIMKVWIGLTR